jgi:uncharacterized protein
LFLIKYIDKNWRVQLIVYHNDVKNFIIDVKSNQIGSIIKENMNQRNLYSGNSSEYFSWVNSMNFIRNVVDDDHIPKDAQVAIEYQIPQTAKRVDFIISGNDGNKDNILIIELKQWEKAEKISDDVEHSIKTFTGGGLRRVAHPSYQAYSYATLIKNTSEAIQNKNVQIIPVAYLHNFLPQSRHHLDDEIFDHWIKEAPFFISNEFEELRNFIRRYIKLKTNDGDLLFKIDKGRLKPSKALQDSIVSMMKGNKEFLLIDEQVTTYDMCKEVMKKSVKDGKKRTIIIQGGPGTGKSVLALNLLQEFTRKNLMANYITKNSAPRNAFLELISKSDLKNKTNLKSLFRSPFGLSNISNNSYDALIIDEAHRLVDKMYRDWNGENQVKECIKASLVSIFLIDENQKITTKDTGSIKSILDFSKELNSEIYYGDELILTSQFRCNGSDGYIQFLNDVLEINKNEQFSFYELNYDLKIYNDPNQMRDDLRKINQSEKHFNKSRIVSGYCYPWNIKNKRSLDYDISLDNGFFAKWNLPDDNKWAINPNSFEEVGCIHTAQGLEFDYVGVIIGKDLKYDTINKKVITDKTQINKDDNSSGIRTATNELAESLIKNTYKTLLTRGQKGCYIYCEDKALSNYLKERLGNRTI